MHSENTNDSGNSLRSKHRSNTGDYVLFADDDNWYEPDALQVVRTVVQHDSNALYIFQIRHLDNGFIQPDLENNGEVEYSNVDTGTTLFQDSLEG